MYILDNGTFNVTATYEEYEEKGDRFIKIVEFHAPWRAENPQYTVKSADKTEADHINKILQEHYVEIYPGFESDYDKLTGRMFMQMANKLLSRVPIKKLFLK